MAPFVAYTDYDEGGMGQKWSGLQRRTPHEAAGHEAANSGAMSDGWLPLEKRARRRDSIA